MDVERESQKVRSLYESGESLDWHDGGRGSYCEHLRSTREVPSDEEENVVYGFSLTAPVSVMCSMLTAIPLSQRRSVEKPFVRSSTSRRRPACRSPIASYYATAGQFFLTATR
jgi:hypothetical protein